MKISEVIKGLQDILVEHGDLEVVKLEEVDNYFEISECNVVDVLEVPKDAYTKLDSDDPNDFDKYAIIEHLENLNSPNLRLV